MTRKRPTPNVLLNQEEEDLRQAFLRAFKRNYPGLNESDLIMLELASIQYVLSVRLSNSDLQRGQYVHSTRFSPHNELRGILSDLGLTRKDRLAKQASNQGTEEEEQVRALLKSITDAPIKTSDEETYGYRGVN